MEKKKPNHLLRTGYVSELDQFLREFDKKRTQFPPARLKEIAKHQKLFDKRDNVVDEGTDPIWKQF